MSVCLGVPMVAAAAIREHKKIVFIDQNPLTLSRFPEISGASEVHFMDAAMADRLRIKASLLIFDSPWYFADSIAWLTTGCRLICPGGTLIFSLYPPLLRPNARSERDQILQVASTIGDVHIREDVLEYQTPLFELEALNACGIRNAGNWRRGDLVVITNAKPVFRPSFVSHRRADLDGQWRTFVLGPQVVKVRINLTSEDRGVPESLLQKIDGDFAFRSVSARCETRELIDVWTSYNRVARLTNTSTLLRLLHQIEAGVSLKDAVEPFSSQFGAHLEEQLREFLNMEN